MKPTKKESLFMALLKSMTRSNGMFLSKRSQSFIEEFKEGSLVKYSSPNSFIHYQFQLDDIGIVRAISVRENPFAPEKTRFKESVIFDRELGINACLMESRSRHG